MTPMEGTDTILALFRRRILGQYPAAPFSPGPFGLLLTYDYFNMKNRKLRAK